LAKILTGEKLFLLENRLSQRFFVQFFQQIAVTLVALKKNGQSNEQSSRSMKRMRGFRNPPAYPFHNSNISPSPPMTGSGSGPLPAGK
jgi:hypothetical protein